MVVMGGAAPAATAQPAPAPVPLRLGAAIEAARALPRLHSLLVSWRGQVVLEQYLNGARAGRLANVKSVSKSIISALVGIALDRKLIANVRQPIAPFFPGLLDRAVDLPKRQITVEDLLTMRSGLESTSSRSYGAWVRSGHWVKHVLTRELQAAPGTTMEYSTGNTHLLSAVLTRVRARARGSSPRRCWRGRSGSRWRAGRAIRRASISAETRC